MSESAEAQSADAVQASEPVQESEDEHSVQHDDHKDSDEHDHEDEAGHDDEAERRKLGAHEHGVAELMIAQSSSDVAIDLERPSYNLLRFE